MKFSNLFSTSICVCQRAMPPKRPSCWCLFDSKLSTAAQKRVPTIYAKIGTLRPKSELSNYLRAVRPLENCVQTCPRILADRLAAIWKHAAP